MRSVTSDGSVAAPADPALGQREVRLALIAAALLNALFFQARSAVEQSGLLGAVLATFGISAIVWVGLAMAAHAVAREPDRAIDRRELAVDLVVLAVLLVPLKHVGWIGLTLLSLNILAHAARGSSAARGGFVLLAVTVPMFWSKLLFSVFSGVILRLDAILVSAVLGLPRVGNTLALADGRTHLWIEASCSSMLNVSLVVLCWTMFCQAWSLSLRRMLGWCILGCAVIVALNVARISAIAAFPEHYDLLHGGIGAGVASWLNIAVMLALFRFGMCRGRAGAPPAGAEAGPPGEPARRAFGLGSGTVARALFVVVLAASVSLKLWTLADPRGAGPSDDATRETLRAFLAEAGFAARIEDGITGLPAASGEREGCRVLLANVAQQGYHRDLIVSKASPGDAVAFLFRGRVFADQPEWSTWATRLLAHLRLAPAEPASSGSERVYALLANGPCTIDRPLWAQTLARAAM